MACSVKNEFSLISYLWSPKNFSSICSILNIIFRGYWKYSREMRTNAKYLFVAIIFFLIPPFFLSQSRLHMYSKLKCNDILSTFFCMRIEFAYLKLRMIYIFLYLESFHFSVWPFNIGVAVLMKLSRWNETLNAYVEYYFHRWNKFLFCYFNKSFWIRDIQIYYILILCICNFNIQYLYQENVI